MKHFPQRLALSIGFLAGAPVLLLVVSLVLIYTGLTVIWKDDIK
jgi:hypothetical protein